MRLHVFKLISRMKFFLLKYYKKTNKDSEVLEPKQALVHNYGNIPQPKQTNIVIEKITVQNTNFKHQAKKNTTTIIAGGTPRESSDIFHHCKVQLLIINVMRHAMKIHVFTLINFVFQIDQIHKKSEMIFDR